jgi:pyruvate,water dikinase
MNYVKFFKELTRKDTSLAGGKGASLGEMFNAKFPIPSGFVVLSNAFDKFLEITDINIELNAILKTVNLQKIDTIENASAKIRSLILGAKIPSSLQEEIETSFKKIKTTSVAVRSSATAEDGSLAAWAGQLDSFLNTNKKTLYINIQKCWASLFTPRAIFYRFQKKMENQKISVSVVVQKLIPSEVSGVAFSVHPVTQDRNQMIIEAGFGLGEAIVSGSITPDSYVLEKDILSLLDKNYYPQEEMVVRSLKGATLRKKVPAKIKNKPKLTDSEIITLAKIILLIEKHYGFPVDVEWAFYKKKFYVLQSRPITTLK